MPLPESAAPAPRLSTPSRKHDDEPRTASLIRSEQFNAMAGAPITLPVTQNNSPAAAAPESGANTAAATPINSQQQPAQAAQLPIAAPAPVLPPATFSAKAAPAPLSFAAKIQTSTDNKSADPSQRIGLNDNVNAVAAAWKKGQHGEQQPQQQEPAITPAPAAASATTTAAPTLNAVETAPALVNPLAAPQAPKTHEAALSPARLSTSHRPFSRRRPPPASSKMFPSASHRKTAPPCSFASLIRGARLQARRPHREPGLESGSPRQSARPHQKAQRHRFSCRNLAPRRFIHARRRGR